MTSPQVNAAVLSHRRLLAPLCRWLIPEKARIMPACGAGLRKVGVDKGHDLA
jgi:hypothetical protein